MPARWTELLARHLPEYGYPAEPAAIARFAQYLPLVVEGNQRARLVGEAAPVELVRRHLGESLYLGQLLALGQQRLLDLGSGAGFPGLALALGWPELNTTLVEATGKKAAFLSAAVVKLGLDQRVTVWPAFIATRPTPNRGPWAGVELVTVRALERMERLPAWLGRWLDPGTQLAAWVGEELAATWQKRHPEWCWSQLHRLPSSDRRGIVLGQRST